MKKDKDGYIVFITGMGKPVRVHGIRTKKQLEEVHKQWQTAQRIVEARMNDPLI